MDQSVNFPTSNNTSLLRSSLTAILVSLMFVGCAGRRMNEPIPARVWGAVGLGAAVPTSGGDGIGNMAQLVYQKAPHHAALRGLVLHDLDRDTDTIGEVAALYGRMRPFGRHHVAVAAGVAAVAFDTCPDDDDSCFTMGIPLVAEAALSSRFIGVGMQAFGNLNRKAPYAGALLFVQLGWLR